MKRVSRRALARATVELLEKHAPRQVIRTLAEAVVANKMTNELDLLINDIALEWQRRYGHVEAEVRSAFPLIPVLRRELESLIRQTAGARTVELEIHEDRQLLGGVIVKTPELNIDLSVRTMLERLRGIRGEL